MNDKDPLELASSIEEIHRNASAMKDLATDMDRYRKLRETCSEYMDGKYLTAMNIEMRDVTTFRIKAATPEDKKLAEAIHDWATARIGILYTEIQKVKETL